MAAPRPLFFSCEITRNLRVVVPHSNHPAHCSQSLVEFGEDYVRSSLRDLAEFRLEQDVALLISRVDGRAQVDGPVLSRYSGASLQILLEDVRAQGMRALSFVLTSVERDDSVEKLDGETRGLDAVMAASRGVHLPLHVEVSDQRDEIVNKLIDEFHQHPEYGGFSDPHTAQEQGLAQFKRLGQVCYYLSPFYDRINKAFKLPQEDGRVDSRVWCSTSVESGL
eukprot:TRINITY_DN1273_c0_g1_i4.p1 TRINITY_DN1273_c0_g1~~TRINITY_DN1273_c0_g1_i4.p1  ORF type:complete len:223 (-),score=22.55 TRINITY_DN1273_c0_g1_i4:165-833(-)